MKRRLSRGLTSVYGILTRREKDTLRAEVKAMMTAKQVAGKFGVRVGTVRQWTREHKIPYLRVNRKVVRYVWAEIERAVGFPPGRKVKR